MKTIYTTQNTPVKVSDEDYDYLNQYNWYSILQPSKNGKTYKYFYRNATIDGKRKRISMHREILERSIGDLGDLFFGDHKDLDTWNNQRSNLRWATSAQNNANVGPRSGRKYKGVYEYAKPNGSMMYRVRIKDNKKLINIGTFADEMSAALAADEAALNIYGEFARLNFAQEEQKKVVENNIDFYQDFISRFELGKQYINNNSINR